MVERPPEEQELESGDELTDILQMMAKRAPYSEVVAALDALSVPGAPLAIASVAHTRLSAASMYERPGDEIAREIERYLAAEWVPWRRLSAVLAACMGSPDLFRRHVDPLIAESEAIAEPDQPLTKVLETARQARQRVFGSTRSP